MTQSKKCQFVLDHADLFRGLESSASKIGLLIGWLSLNMLWVLPSLLLPHNVLQFGTLQTPSWVFIVLPTLAIVLITVAISLVGIRVEKNIKRLYTNLLLVSPKSILIDTKKERARTTIFLGFIVFISVLFLFGHLLLPNTSPMSMMLLVFTLISFADLKRIVSINFRLKTRVATYYWFSAVFTFVIIVAVWVAWLTGLISLTSAYEFSFFSAGGLVPSYFADSIEGLFDHRLLMQAIRWRQTSS
jgi:hypothetical protein